MREARNPIAGHTHKDQPYWQVFDAVGDGLIVQDTETLRVLEANHAAASDAWIQPRGIHWACDFRTTCTPTASATSPSPSSAVQSGGVFEAAAIHLRRDGSPFHVEVRRTAFTYQSRPCLLSVVRDVSKRVQAEEFLLQQAGGAPARASRTCSISPTRWPPPWSSSRTLFWINWGTSCSTAGRRSL